MLCFYSCVNVNIVTDNFRKAKEALKTLDEQSCLSGSEDDDFRSLSQKRKVPHNRFLLENYDLHSDCESDSGVLPKPPKLPKRYTELQNMRQNVSNFSSVCSTPVSSNHSGITV